MIACGIGVFVTAPAAYIAVAYLYRNAAGQPVATVGIGVSGGDCVFCAVVAGSEPSHVVLDEPDVVAFLDDRPVFKGHVLVIPRGHVVTLPELPADLLAPLFGAVAGVARPWSTPSAPQGSWVAENNIVSQAVPHLHVHVVPRTKGDGLRGFFWPRQKYEGEAEMAEYADALCGPLLTDSSSNDVITV